MTIQQALNEIFNELLTVTDNPKLEADILLSYVLKKPRSHLYAWPETALNKEQTGFLSTVLQERCKGVPIAYITGKHEFRSLSLDMVRGTFIPRPETELLVEQILNLFAGPPIKMADLGTGSGAIALSLACERTHWRIYATDINPCALLLAKHNARQLQLRNVRFFSGHWLDALPETNFDLIVSNPPYIAANEWDTYQHGLAFEPITALVSGTHGLDAIDEIITSAINYLKPGGCLAIEHGFAQGKGVRNFFLAAHYRRIETHQDLSGLDRFTIGFRYN